MVVFQDTAGQERFSSLSSAFFRGADAVLMVYDVNKPQTLYNLRKWWHEFQERAPVPDEDAYGYCCVVVGNKVDLLDDLSDLPLSEDEVKAFLQSLIPSTSDSTASPAETIAPSTPFRVSEDHPTDPLSPDYNVSDDDSSIPLSDTPNNSVSHTPIDIRHSGRGHHSLSRATSRSRFGGTMTTTHTGLSVYYTPTASLFEEYISAPSSPTANSRINHSPGRLPSTQRRRTTATSTTSSSDTITPSIFARAPPPISTSPTPAPLEKGPKLFLASAKSGKHVPDIFQYISKRVVSRWEWEESVQTRVLDYSERSEIRTVNLQSGKGVSRIASCCGS
ncbi:hypothetical protein Clacol_002999 [Clathrus columnatus]|uniref:Ras-domain-containing protein n=1 Tax=Clathrus columnatus TaxID=1419009 RepID=A0AAV5A735_9AGAM|nr:hypothetical protein Clacol_002999 [Clathrus columnatus]